jgi:hypothetical protein
VRPSFVRGRTLNLELKPIALLKQMNTTVEGQQKFQPVVFHIYFFHIY